MITLFQAIQSLVPGAEVSVGIYDQSIIWHRPRVAPVTLEQIQQEQQRLQQAYDWDQYQRNRAREYPSIEEQLDALYHAGVFPPEMAARIQAVKEKYPRGSSEHSQAVQAKTPVRRRITQQAPQSAPAMTREEWLASQVEVKTVHNSTPTNTVTVTRTMSTQEWLQEQASQEYTQIMAREQWLEQQKNQEQPRKLTREEWLAEQVNIGN